MFWGLHILLRLHFNATLQLPVTRIKKYVIIHKRTEALIQGFSPFLYALAYS